MIASAHRDLRSTAPIQKTGMKSKDPETLVDAGNNRNKPSPKKNSLKQADRKTNTVSKADKKQSKRHTAKNRFASQRDHKIKEPEILSEKPIASALKRLPPKLNSVENAMNAKEKAKTSDPTDTLPEVTALALQAIAWASEPNQRIAVINGQITKEGGLIDGYRVGRIEENAVIVYKGEIAAKLEFKAK